MLTADNIDVRARNNVHIVGNPDGRTVVFAHGFGCSQETWRAVVPYFLDDYNVVLFDLVGAGGSDVSAYSRSKYDSVRGYATDVVEMLEQLDLHDVVFVGHSVSSMIGVVASTIHPSRISTLVLVGPSPRYVNDGEYVGGFEQADIDAMLDSLDLNYLGWSEAMAPVIAGNPDRPHVGEALTASFCSIDPTIARHFARVTFLSDNRSDLAHVTVPTLVLQCTDDVIAPEVVGRFVHQQVAGSTLVTLPSTGHLPSLSAPEPLAEAILDYLK